MTGPVRVAVVANPAATRVDAGTLARVSDALRPHAVVAAISTTSAHHTREVAAELGDGRADVVVAVGGDGTVAAIATALAGTAVRLLPLPAGSTSVFARGVGWPRHLRDCLPLLADAVAGTPRDLRLGHVHLDGGDARVMCVNAGIGIDAEAVRWVEDHPDAKRRLRQGAFALGAAGPGGRALLGPRVAVGQDDGAPVPAATVMVACGRPYAYLGARALDLLPRAAWDGRLEWVALRRPSPLGAGRAALRALAGGGHLADPGLVGGLTGGAVHVRSSRPVAVQADGEPLGRATHVVLRPGPPLRVVVPPRTAAAGPPQGPR